MLLIGKIKCDASQTSRIRAEEVFLCAPIGKTNGDFAIREQMVTNMKWDMDGFALDSMEIGGGDSALSLAAGLLSSTGSLKLVDNQINQQAQVILQQPDFSSSGNKYIQQLAGLLNQQAQIPLTLGATG